MKYKIIGNMTGNSMDAIDLVLTEFNKNKIRDIATYSKPYSKIMQRKIEKLRQKVFNKTRTEIEALPDFQKIHDEYITQIADCIDDMCQKNHIDKKSINAIGFHGKTLDHNPPSKAIKEGSLPYTLQLGSGQMLADLSGIPVVYDFRSDYIFSGLEGAPLIPPHNVHISKMEGDGIYYNGGNTANFSVILNGKILIASDAGPFNEYVDAAIRQNTKLPFDKNGLIGRKGKLDLKLFKKLFSLCKDYYETSLPKSGDPAYYQKKEVLKYISKNKISFHNAVYTLEYFAAYIAAHALTLIPTDIPLPFKIILFGGGWKNPVIKNCFKNLLVGKGTILPEHTKQFQKLTHRFHQKPILRYSAFGKYMEARLLADLAYHKLQNKVWEISNDTPNIVCGEIAFPQQGKHKCTDCLNRAAKGWQKN